MKILFRTATCRALLVLIQCPLLHIQILWCFQHIHSFLYLFLHIFCFPRAPSHSCFQWRRWVPHNDPYFHTLKKLLFLSYGWNQNTIWKNSCNQSRQSISQPSRFWARLLSDSNPCKPGPLDYDRRESCPLLLGGRRTLDIIAALSPNQGEFQRQQKVCKQHKDYHHFLEWHNQTTALCKIHIYIYIYKVVEEW